MSNELIHWFETGDLTDIPNEFTYPFHYTPHPLAKKAAQELQNYLDSKSEWKHNFGFDDSADGKATGKMFGVLIVENNGRYGYLWAFSGRLGGSNKHPQFVPPVFDILDENGFFRKGETELGTISDAIEGLLNSERYVKAKVHVKTVQSDYETAISELKAEHSEKKKRRSLLRKNSGSTHSPELDAESKSDHFELKQFKSIWNEKVELAQKELNLVQGEIELLKESRAKLSANLQQQIFHSFSFLNAQGEERDLKSIFDEFDIPFPQAGSGECSAPKLLNYAYQNGLKPIAMAEFWWGNPPKTIIRKHGHFYPACKSKCKPILSHMLKGLTVEANPLENDPFPVELEVIYEDEDIIAINKPSGMLSVPGKTKRASVLSIIKSQVPTLEGPVIVHRLDMSTSGIMLLAKNMNAYHALQDQFAERTIEKTYLALLEGVPSESAGTIDLPLRVDLDNRPQQMVCNDHGKQAITEFKVVEIRSKRTLIEFHPLTGRTHQLRVHSAHPLGLNTPIVGDDLYGKVDKRLCLHAQKITFTHPGSKERMTFETKLPF